MRRKMELACLGEAGISPRAARWLAAAWYCVYWAGLAAITPYFMVFFASVGLNDQQIGVVAAVRQWISVPASLFWSSVADGFGAHRAVLLLVLVLSTLSRIAIAWGSSFSMFVGLVLMNQFFTSPVTVLADTILMSSAKHDGDYGKIRAWGALGWGSFSAVAGLIITRWGYLAGFIISALLTTPCGPATCVFKFRSKQQAALDVLQEAEAARQAAAEAGQAQQHAPGSVEPGAPTDAQHAADPAAARGAQQHADALAEVAVAPALPGKAKPGGQQPLREREAKQLLELAQLSHAARLKLLLRDVEVWLFLWQALLQGYGLGLYQSFLFLTLQQMGASQVLMGLTITVDCLAEFPAFYFKEAVLRVLSVDALLHVSVLAYALRLALYAVLPLWRSPWLVLPVQLLHGLTYAWGWGAGTIKGRRLAPPGQEATMQGLFQLTYIGVGAGIGSLVGGSLMQALGAQWMWGITSVSVLAGWLGHTGVRGAMRLRAAVRAHSAARAPRRAGGPAGPP